MTHILHTRAVHKTASLADEGNSAYCQSSDAHNIRGHLNTDDQARDRTRNFLLTRTTPQLHKLLCGISAYKKSKLKYPS